MEPSKTWKTEDDYRRRARQLYERIRVERGRSHCDIAPRDVVEFIQNRGRTLPDRTDPKDEPTDVWSRATFRLSKAAVLFHFREQLNHVETRLEAQELQFAIGWLESLTQSDYLKRGRHTSARKAKRVTDEDIARLIATLDHRTKAGHRWAKATQHLLIATRATGLRPSEWARVILYESEPDGNYRLEVINAKATNGRANGIARTMHLISPPTEALSSIDEVLYLAHAVQGGYFDRKPSTWAELLSYVRRELLIANRIAFRTRKKLISLYSLRHQLLADAKSAGLTQQEVAALAGHASDATAGRHYARRVSGRGTVGAKPDPSNVATVQRRARVRHKAPQPDM